MSARTPVLAVLALACASTGPAPSQPPHSFQDVRSVALVRRVEDPGAPQGKDPLDALRDSLVERGYEARIVELGRGHDAPREVERLYARVDGRLASISPSRPGTRTEQVGRGEAAAALAALGVDAVAVYHRFSGQPLLPPAMTTDPFDPLASPGGLYPAQRGGVPYRPIGAVALVDRDGDLVRFEWGSPAAIEADAPANAAEAVDALLRVLTGQAADGA